EGGFGRVTLGRDMNPFHNIIAAYDIDGRNTFSTTSNNLYSGTFRSNAITYTSPNFSGFTFRAQTSQEAGEDFDATGTRIDEYDDKAYALAVSYANGPLSVGAAYEKVEDES